MLYMCGDSGSFFMSYGRIKKKQNATIDKRIDFFYDQSIRIF